MRLAISLCVVPLVCACSLIAEPLTTIAQAQIIINVVDREGMPITELMQSDFRVQVNGKAAQAQIQHVEIASPRIAILLDASASVTTLQRNWTIARAVAEHLTYRGRSSRISLIVFAGRIQTILDFSRTPEEILSYLDSLKDSGKVLAAGADRRTALLDTLNHACTLFGSPLPGDSLFVITDGGDTRSSVKQFDVERALVSHGIRFFGLTLPAGTFVTDEERSGRSMLERFAEVSGGRTIEIADDVSEQGRAKLTAILDNIYQNVRFCYRLDLPHMEPYKSCRLKIEVLDRKGKRRGDLKLAYPRDVPCDSGLRRQ